MIHNMYRGMLSVLLLLLILSVASGCSSEEGATGEKAALKISVDSKGTYEYLYKDYIEAAFPEMKIELIEMYPDNKRITLAEYKKKIELNKPDLILTSRYEYDQLASEGIFADLTEKMKDSGMKEEDFYPGMIDLMKRSGSGKLYGLAPSFQSAFLYYNEDLFEKAGVELPRDGMTLEEVYKLASRFTSAGERKDGVVGFHQQFINEPSDILNSFAISEGLQDIDYQKGKIVMNTPTWKHVLDMVINLYQFGTLSLKGAHSTMMNGVKTFNKEDSEQADLFGQGKAAMTIIYYNEKNNYKFKWGAVLPPVSSLQKDRSSNIYIFNTMAIRSGANNSEMAWKVIQLMTSDYMAKVFAKLGMDNGFSSRRSYTNYVQDPMITKVYELLPVYVPYPSVENYDFDRMIPFYKSYQELINKQVTTAVKGEQSVDQTLAAIQKEGQALLDAAKIKK